MGKHTIVRITIVPIKQQNVRIIQSHNPGSTGDDNTLVAHIVNMYSPTLVFCLTHFISYLRLRVFCNFNQIHVNK